MAQLCDKGGVELGHELRKARQIWRLAGAMFTVATTRWCMQQRVDGATIPWTTARVRAVFFCRDIAQTRQKFVRVAYGYAAAPITKAVHSVLSDSFLGLLMCFSCVPVTAFRQNAFNNAENSLKCLEYSKKSL